MKTVMTSSGKEYSYERFQGCVSKKKYDRTTAMFKLLELKGKRPHSYFCKHCKGFHISKG